MIRIKTNDKPRLPKCEMVCDSMLDPKLNKYDLTSFLNCHAMTLLIGKPRSGKTSLLHSMFEHKGLLRHCYNKIYLFQPAQSGASIKDCIFDMLPDDQIYHELNFDTLYEVKCRIEADAADGHTSCIIFDDMAAELKRKETLMLFKQLAFNRRHLRLSMYFLVQTWFSVPKEMRRLWSNIFVFKVSKNEMANIWDEIIEHDQAYVPTILKTVYNEPYKFLFINTDSQRMFDGWNELIFDDP
jgi:hypothetical protein